MDRLVSCGTLKPIETNSWGTQIVAITELDCNIRLRRDYSATLNPYLEVDSYPDRRNILPTVDELKEACLTWAKHIQKKTNYEKLQNLNEGTQSKRMNQLGLLLDKTGPIRSKRRLLKSNINENCKFPKILPKNDPFTHRIIKEYHHKIYHDEVQHPLLRTTQGTLDST